MRTHHLALARNRFVLAALAGTTALGVGACTRPAATDVVAAPLPAVTPTPSTSPPSPAPVVTPVAAHSPPVRTSPARRGCAPVRPASGFYEAGRVGTAPLTTPVSRCTTISVSNIMDPAHPDDRCQTFLVGLWPLVDGSLTYTEPVTACGGTRTVLARDIPDHTRFLVLYDVDYIDPQIQNVTFKVWR